MKKLFITLVIVLSGLGLGGIAAGPATVYAANHVAAACGSGGAAPKDQALAGLGITGGGCSGDKVTSLPATVVNILSYIVGVVAIIMIILAGFKYITAGGDSNRISSAKTTLIYALVGIVIVVLAQALVRFVISSATGA